MAPPKDLDEAINLISSVIADVSGSFTDEAPPPPSADLSPAAADALNRCGPLGVEALNYMRYTETFVESFKNTPLLPRYKKPFRRLENPRFDVRTNAYEDVFNENKDRRFLEEFYFLALEVLRVHVFHAWDKIPMDGNLKTEVFEALDTLWVWRSEAGLTCELEWKGETVTVLQIESKHNGYALPAYSIKNIETSAASLISLWRDEKVDRINTRTELGSVVASKILTQLWHSSFRDSTLTVSQSVYGAYFVGLSQQEGKATIFLSENLMQDYPGDSTTSRRQPEAYRHLAYMFCWHLIYALNGKLGRQGLQLYPPVEEYGDLNALGRGPRRDGGAIPVFRQWGSWLAGWVYQLFGLQLPLVARRIRVSPVFEAFEIVGRESSYLTLDLFLDEIVPGTVWSLIRFSRKLKLVLKTYDNVELFQSEKAAYEKLGGSDFFPTLVAEVRGEISGEPGLLVTYCGERLLCEEEDLQDDDLVRISDAVKFMHAQGVHHHDIHPGNLVRGEDGQIRVIDFGLADTSEQCRWGCDDTSWISGRNDKNT